VKKWPYPYRYSCQTAHYCTNFFLFPGLPRSAGDAELSVPLTEEDIEEALQGNKAFREIGAAHTQISEMLGEECAHLLRKAQTAMNKASGAAK
jgi:hypothetical protein